MNWTGKCHKCGVNIFNGVPEGEDISTYVEKKKQEGWIIGYREKLVGGFGSMRTGPIKPICANCSQKESQARDAKEKKKMMSKISKIIKKEFICPCCFHSVERGYNTKVFRTSSKQEMINHINEKHDTKEIENVIPRDRSDY